MLFLSFVDGSEVHLRTDKHHVDWRIHWARLPIDFGVTFMPRLKKALK